MGFNIHILSGRRPSQNLDVRAAVAARVNPAQFIPKAGRSNVAIKCTRLIVMRGLCPSSRRCDSRLTDRPASGTIRRCGQQIFGAGFNFAILGVLDDLFDDRGTVPLDEFADAPG